jgi:tetratricopeptide (TPR) repeat protein
MKRSLSVLAVLLSAGLAAPARGQPKAAPEGATREKAAALFKEADANYKVREFAKALAGYKEAYLLSSEPVLLFNIGQCYRQMGQLDEALKSYEAFLRDDPTSALRANAEARIKELRDRLLKAAERGSLQISSQQDPAGIYLDGKYRGDSPLKIDDVSPGEHRVSVQKKGFVGYELAITVEPGQPFVLAVPLLIEAARPPAAGRLLLFGAAGAGAAALATGGVALLSAARFRGQPEQSRDDLRLVLALGLAADVLAGTAAASGAAGFLILRRFKRAQRLEASLGPAGAALALRF